MRKVNFVAKRLCFVQYFLGGSGEWADKSYADICDELIPLEIALRVAKAIMRDEPFAAYIIIPMWPEGAARYPSSSPGHRSCAEVSRPLTLIVTGPRRAQSQLSAVAGDVTGVARLSNHCYCS